MLLTRPSKNVNRQHRSKAEAWSNPAIRRVCQKSKPALVKSAGQPSIAGAPPLALVHETEDRPPNKLSVIVDAARYQSSDLQGEIAPEPVSIFLIESIGLTANNGPGRLEDGHQGNIVKFSLPSLSSHVGPHD